jgi:hypothetical protein
MRFLRKTRKRTAQKWCVNALLKRYVRDQRSNLFYSSKTYREHRAKTETEKINNKSYLCRRTGRNMKETAQTE